MRRVEQQLASLGHEHIKQSVLSDFVDELMTEEMTDDQVMTEGHRLEQKSVSLQMIKPKKELVEKKENTKPQKHPEPTATSMKMLPKHIPPHKVAEYIGYDFWGDDLDKYKDVVAHESLKRKIKAEEESKTYHEGSYIQVKAPTQRRNKSDPVSLYHQHKQEWDQLGSIGTRRTIKTSQNTHTGHVNTRKSIPGPSNYQVPSMKRRDSLRWSMRSKMLSK